MGNVDHTGLHHVQMAAVTVENFQILSHSSRSQLTVFFGKCQHLVAVGFDGTTLMHRNVSGIRRDHALPGSEQALDHSRIGLGTSHQKMYFRIGTAAGSTDLVLGLCTIRIVSVSKGMFHIGFHQLL